jgi:hypothetical protein
MGFGLCVYLVILAKLVFHHCFQRGRTGVRQAAYQGGDLVGPPVSIATKEGQASDNSAMISLKSDTTKNPHSELSKLQNNKEERQTLLAESLKRIRQKALQALNDPNHMELRFRENPGDGRPPFSSLFDKHSNGKNNNITADVSDLLQFAIIGFGKCASTTMRDWLNTHPNVQCYYPHEVLDLMQHDVRQLLSRLYSMPVMTGSKNTTILRGFKSPVDLSIRHVMQEYYRKYFYKTKLIVGLRHPVHWFESLCK